MLTSVLILLLFPALMAFAAASDLITMTISNRIALALIAGFLTLAWATGMSLQTVGSHAGAALVVLVIGFACFARGWIGGGDAKLAAASALWLGFEQLVPYLVHASLLGGVLTVLMIRFRLAPLPEPLAHQDWIARLHRVDAGVPYGIALAASALLVYPETGFMKFIVL